MTNLSQVTHAEYQCLPSGRRLEYHDAIWTDSNRFYPYVDKLLKWLEMKCGWNQHKNQQRFIFIYLLMIVYFLAVV